MSTGSIVSECVNDLKEGLLLWSEPWSKPGWLGSGIVMEVLVVADSRGRGLELMLEKELPERKVKVLTLGGAGSELAALRALSTIKTSRPDMIILMTGICDLTWRDKRSQCTSLRSGKIADCVENVMGPLRAAYEIMTTEGGPNTPISIATVTGLDLADYNFRGRRQMTGDEYRKYSEGNKTKHGLQETLNMAMVEINRRITALNKEHGVPTTWISTVIHAYYRGTHHHNYKRLKDGCHPDEETKVRWVRQLGKTINRVLGQRERV